MFTFKITPEAGDPYEVRANTRDVLVWEKSTRDRTMGQLMQDMSLVDLYKIAHIAARREGLCEDTLSEFQASCDLTLEEGEEEPNPTQKARSTGG